MAKIDFKTHYRLYHEQEVPEPQVIRVIATGRRKRKGKDLIEFKTPSFYVLCRYDAKEEVLYVIQRQAEAKKEMKCNKCKVAMQEKEFEIEDTGIKAKALVCPKCHDLVFEKESGLKAAEEYERYLAKKPALTLRRKITRIGKRFALYVPQDVVRSLDLEKKEVEIYVPDKKRVVLEIVD